MGGDGDINNPMYMRTIPSSSPLHQQQHQSNQNTYSNLDEVVPGKGKQRNLSVPSTNGSTCSLLNNRSSTNSSDQTYAVVDEPSSSSVVDDIYLYADTGFHKGNPHRGSKNTHQVGLNPITENHKDSVFQPEEVYHELEQPEYGELDEDIIGRSQQPTETYTSLAQNQQENYAELTNQNRDSIYQNTEKQEQSGTYAALQKPAQQQTYEPLVGNENKTNMAANGRDYNRKHKTTPQETYASLDRDHAPQAETYEQLVNNNEVQCDQGTYSALDCPAQETYESLTNPDKDSRSEGQGIVNPNYESGDSIYHILTPK